MDEIRALIDEINGILAAMSKEKRLRFFKQYPVPLDFAKEIDGTTYLVRTYFDSTASESIAEKTARIVITDKQQGQNTAH